MGEGRMRAEEDSEARREEAQAFGGFCPSAGMSEILCLGSVVFVGFRSASCGM